MRSYYEPVIAALAETGTPFEINTAGWRKECAEQYPARGFLELARAEAVPLLINSDAHALGELTAGFGGRRGAGEERGLHPDCAFSPPCD